MWRAQIRRICMAHGLLEDPLKDEKDEQQEADGGRKP